LFARISEDPGPPHSLSHHGRTFTSIGWMLPAIYHPGMIPTVKLPNRLSLFHKFLFRRYYALLQLHVLNAYSRLPPLLQASPSCGFSLPLRPGTHVWQNSDSLGPTT